MAYRAAIITLSDSGFCGEREDVSGSVIAEIVEKEGYEVVRRELIPDEEEMLAALLTQICDGDEADLVLTTGGTRVFKERQDAGGNEAGNRAGGTGNLGGNEVLFPADYTERDALARCIRHPEGRTDCESPGEPEGSTGVSGICDWGIGTWA